MTHYPDLSTSCMVESGAHVRVVGWLAPAFHFERGEVSPEFYTKLCQQCMDAYEPMRLRGYHECEFLVGQSTPCTGRDYRNVWIPGQNGCLYVAPRMITHYIDVHSYKPPEEFIQAVLAAPDQKSSEYWRLMTPFGYAEPELYGLSLRVYEALSQDEQYKLQLKSKRTPEWEQEQPVEAAVVFGTEHFEQGNFHEAANRLQAAIDHRKGDQSLLLMFATACQKCGRFEDAIRVSSDIAARNMEYPGTVTRGKDALLVRALSFMGLQDYEKAKADFATVIERDEYCAEAYFGLSQISHALGLVEEASSYREKARALGFAGA